MNRNELLIAFAMSCACMNIIHDISWKEKIVKKLSNIS